MKRVALLCLALSLALTGCAQGVEIVPIESLSPEKTAANLFSAQPFATPEPTRQAEISYAVFCLKKKKIKIKTNT